MNSQPDHALDLLVQVARALGPLLEEVVFIGGAVAVILQTDRPFDEPRPTQDVDAIVGTINYSDFERIQRTLRSLGFREAVSPGRPAHVHQWLAPGEVKFDLVPAGDHLGASGNPWDLVAFEEAVTRELEEGLVIRYASAPGFMVLKLAAFHDRGRDDPFLSPDLEDIIALVASRPTLISEVAAAKSDMRTFIREQIGILRARPDYMDLLAGHLANVSRDRSKEVFEATDGRFEDLLAE